MLNRRDFLKTAGLAAGTLALPGLTGCAMGSRPRGHVVVVGGGYGGATVAKYLRMWSDMGVDVTLVERTPQFISCPISNLVIGGDKTMADITLGYDGLRSTWGVKLLVWFHPNDNAQDTDGGEFVKFCCEDIPAGAEFGLHDVELRVWDDGNQNGIIGDNEIINGLKDNYNTTWVTVRVENKLAPVLVCPTDVTITCDLQLNLSLDEETNVNDVDLTMTGYPQAYDLCTNLETTYKDQWVGSHDPVCKSGTVRRTFKVTKGTVVVTCTQFITVSTITVHLR